MYAYGKHLGLAFQVVDDILDFTQVRWWLATHKAWAGASRCQECLRKASLGGITEPGLLQLKRFSVANDCTACRPRAC